MTRLGWLVRWTWYPTFLALAFIGEPYAQFDIGLSSGGRLLLVAVAIGVGLTVVWTRLLGRDHGAAVAAVFVMGFVAATTPPRALAFAAAAALIAIEGLLARRGALRVRLPWPRITEALNVLLAVVLVLQLGRAAVLRLTAATIPVPAGWSVGVASVAGAPDVFVILADGHGRADVLASGYGYDMADFRATLTGLGFDEATNSHANHALTRFSLGVLFNGRPLTEMGQDISAPVDERIPFASLHSSSAAELLGRAGYEFTVIASGYEHLTLGGDRNIDVGPRNEIEQAMLDGTAVGQAFDRLTDGHFPGVRTRTLAQIDTLGAIANVDLDRPSFVFAHLPAPHWPIVFEADCSLRPTDRYTRGALDRGNHRGNQVAIDATRDQTICADRLLAQAVQEIVAARPNAVVIVLSDHGPEERLDWSAPDEPGLGDRMTNLFWARTPGHSQLFPEDVTLVNVLPILFNAYLGTALPLHPNDLFFGPAPNNDRFVPYEPIVP